MKAPSPAVAGASQQTTVNMDFPPEGFRKHHFFNRYFVSDLDAAILIDFGLLDRSGVLLDSFSLLYNIDSLRRFKDTFSGYFAKIVNQSGDFEKIQPITWQPLNGCRQPLYNVDFLGLSMVNEIADIDLYHVPVRKVSNTLNKKSTGSISGTPLASLRSPIAIHKLLIKDILLRADKL